MTRPTKVQIDATALLHNVQQVKRHAPGRQIIAMVKANAYGCGLPSIIPVLEGHVDAFGVACIEEALAIKALGACTDCILFQGFFNQDELALVVEHNLQVVIHQSYQLEWLLAQALPKPVRVWVKVNTGMHRLGFAMGDVYGVLNALHSCPWVDRQIGLITHLACADELNNPANQEQLGRFFDLRLPEFPLVKSIGNSAAILSLPDSHAEVVRPGIMLYGISPFKHTSGQELGLIPVMRFLSSLTAVQHYPAGVRVGYGGEWQTAKPSVIGVVAVGYGDGYPRHIAANTPVWINGYQAPIVGRVSMDMLTVDLSHVPEAAVGDPVELWGVHIPVETIAAAAGTIPYELICQLSPRVRRDKL
ncbi:alanine racemase [Legionella quinlivanii]|uniref:Alanine racemase n=1 Tax=Legionella quinlivanii TaxID=45073 RepID=A0A0W0XNK1_9GAMM|nr:alanine racemase [Legionella quinlivanii]KTD46110.1 alanine racemase [Legionella quinlivanii]MCW8451200.1 alanine racemase [Legionella quinlivanii]SEG28443.1 alanine racemase [Legionella quinlivanii DSM 21216]STY10607.1 alanine racemase [Legionella quinlivanii]